MRRQKRISPASFEGARVETGLNSYTAHQLEVLSAHFAGKVTLSGGTGYNDARMGFMHTYQSYPQIIANCVCETDVVAALKFARESRLKVVARSGGHSTAGFSVNDQVVIDTSGISHVLIDREARIARVGPGTPFRKLNLMLDAVGLHVPGGGCETVCVAGYMQGGGYGFTSRLYGMNCDNVVGLTLVLADGTVVRARPGHHDDLFWAVRGGTGNQFGVLVDVEYRLVERGHLFGFGLRFPLTSKAEVETASRVLADLQTFYSDGGVPKIGLQSLIMYLPTAGKLDGQVPGLNVRGVYDGTMAEAKAALGPILAHVADEQQQIEIWKSGSYLHLNEILLQTVNPPGNDMPSVSFNTKPLADCRIVAEHHPPERWREVLEHFLKTPDKTTFVAVEYYGGAINELAPDANAFVHRRASLDLFAWSFWTFDSNKQRAVDWLEEFGRIAQSMGNGHRYQNYPRRGNPDFREHYFGTNLGRLMDIKLKYDPHNLFDYEQGLLHDAGKAGETTP